MMDLSAMIPAAPEVASVVPAEAALPAMPEGAVMPGQEVFAALLAAAEAPPPTQPAPHVAQAPVGESGLSLPPMIPETYKQESLADQLVRALVSQKGNELEAAGAEGEPASAPGEAPARSLLSALKTSKAPTLTRENVETPTVVRQLTDALHLQMGKRVKTAQVQLNPAELGKVDLQMRYEAGGVRIFATVESSATAELLVAGLDSLRAELSAQGVQLDGFEVSTETPPEEQDAQEEPREEREQPRREPGQQGEAQDESSGGES